jgi:hypothetical protein
MSAYAEELKELDMGWTFMPMPYEGTTEWFKKHLTWTNEDGTTHRPLETAIVARSEAYAAVETVKPDGERYVWAAAFMLKYNPKDRDGYTFGYKDMDETVGPVIDRCPAKILDLLTPTDREYAIAWRERCRARIERRKANKVANGDILKLEHPLSYGGYGKVDTFKVQMNGNKVNFWALDSDTLAPRFLCRITNWREREFSRVDPREKAEPAKPSM